VPEATVASYAGRDGAVSAPDYNPSFEYQDVNRDTLSGFLMALLCESTPLFAYKKAGGFGPTGWDVKTTPFGTR
jgi:hypothetical protein